jgi:hypothetical protein
MALKLITRTLKLSGMGRPVNGWNVGLNGAPEPPYSRRRIAMGWARDARRAGR